MPQKARLRVRGHAHVEVGLVTAYLVALKRAYDSIVLFETLIDRAGRAPLDDRVFAYLFGWNFAGRVCPAVLDPLIDISPLVQINLPQVFRDRKDSSSRR
jgi:hypothetical protein